MACFVVCVATEKFVELRNICHPNNHYILSLNFWILNVSEQE